MVAIVFPGQGSQKPGMGKELYQAHSEARAVFDEVQEATGIDVAKLSFESDEETLRLTQNAQMALYTCGLAAAACLPHFEEPVFAGHSVGEYAAVVSAGVLSVGDGAKLVQRRGELMSQAPAGGMAAILGLDRELLEQVCRECSSDSEVVVIANDNCPGQLVISGHVAAIERACEAAKLAGAKRALPLNVSGAFHSPLMHDAATQMSLALEAAPFGAVPQKWTVYANVTADKVEHARDWPDLLAKQLESPVRWTESVQVMAREGITTFIECGSGEVLCGLIRRISPEVTTMAAFDEASRGKTLENLREVSPR